MFVRLQAVLWCVAGGCGLVLLAWPDLHFAHAERFAYVAGAAMAVALVAFFAWPIPPESPVEPVLFLDVRRQRQVCPRCLRRNSAARVRCRGCLAPVGWRATVDPFWSAVAEGWAYGALVRCERPNAVLLVAAWVWLLPHALASQVVPAWFGIQSRSAMDIVGAVVLWWFAIAFGAIGLFGVWNVTRNWLRERGRPSDPEEPRPEPGTT